MVGTGLALLLLAAPLSAEEVVSYAASAGGTNGWSAAGLRIEAKDGALRFALEAGGAAEAELDLHCAVVPGGLVRWLGRVEGGASALLHVVAGHTEADLPLRGWDEPADFNLPPDATSCRVGLRLRGDAGAAFVLRELLVTGVLDLDPPLMRLPGGTPSAWRVENAVAFTGAVAVVRGAAETRDHLPAVSGAVVGVWSPWVAGRGVRVAGRAWGAEGEQLGDVPLGAIAEAGTHRFDPGAAAWPAGTAAISLRFEAASTNDAAALAEVVAGRAQ